MYVTLKAYRLIRSYNKYEHFYFRMLTWKNSTYIVLKKKKEFCLESLEEIENIFNDRKDSLYIMISFILLITLMLRAALSQAPFIKIRNSAEIRSAEFLIFYFLLLYIRQAFQAYSQHFIGIFNILELTCIICLIGT